ncbi:MAG TPA: AMP-binding protein [Clostridiaceae bacterium]|nr:AMP-binding protein [Clostridiaceae bacterium]
MRNTLDLINITEGKSYYNVPKINTLKEMLKMCADNYSKNIAFKFRHKPRLDTITKTYSEFSEDINAFGSSLIKLGLKNSKIAIIGENRYEWIVSYLATTNGVGVAVPLDRMLPPNEIELMLERGEADVLVYSQSFQQIAESISNNNKNLKALICMNPEKTDFIDNSRFFSFEYLLNKGKELLKNDYNEYTNIDPDPDVLSVLLFTSGTSANSKAVMLSHKNICSDIMSLGGVVHFKPGDSVLSILPLHHTFENTTGLLFPLFLGMTVSISDGLKYLSKNLTEYQPDCLIGVPLIFDKFKGKILDEIKKKGMEKKINTLMGVLNFLSYLGIDLRRKVFKKLLEPFGGKLKVIVTGGAAIENSTTKFYENIGVKVYQGYGLTETSPVVAGGNDYVRKTGTCGNPLPGVKIAIANPDSNGSGELVIKGNNVMLGYWKNEKATREATVDGWFHTGDLGRIDRKGLITVTGRVKSMIVLNNGKKVFPEELENYINKVPYVKESLVWGETTKQGNVEICAKIVLDKENITEVVKCPDDENAIKKLLDSAVKEINKLMPVYKKIRYYVFSYEDLIKTTTMKIKRYVETDQIRVLFMNMATSIKNAAGKNIDKLQEMFAKSVENY